MTDGSYRRRNVYKNDSNVCRFVVRRLPFSFAICRPIAAADRLKTKTFLTLFQVVEKRQL